MAPRKRRAAAQAPPADDGSDNEAASGSDGGAPSSEAAVETQAAGSSLQFSESLLGRPGRPIPVGTLLKRLQKLSEELRALDQDVSDELKEACRPVAKELGDQSILVHKDKGVRAWAGQCIVDLLALCAPDAPFSLQQLKAIFEMFVKTVFPALADPSNAYNLQHIYVLESLANIKSILLITDLPNANKLMTQLFTNFFDIYSGTARGSTGEEPVSKHVEYTMLQTLVTLVDEADNLPQEVVDIIVAQFLRADPRLVGQREQKAKKGEKVDEKQTTLVRQELPTGYLMARDICNMVPEKMAREVSKYFSEVIMEASGAGLDGKRRKKDGDGDDAEDADADISEEDMKELQKAHRLVRELWRACPGVLQSVIPQLEAELSAENIQLRVLATETLGDLISGIGAAGPPPNPIMDASAYPTLSLSAAQETDHFDPMTTPKAPQPFSQAHPQPYSSFLGRRQDKAAAVRASWTIAIGRILTTNAGGVGIGPSDERKLVEDLARMLNDAEEKVRLAAVEAIGSFNCYDSITKLGSVGGVDKEGSVLANLAVHIKDRKAPVRAACMTALSRLWGVCQGEIAEGNQQVIDAVGNVPSHVLNSYYTNTPELFELLDKALFEELLPVTYPPIKSKGKDKDKANGSQRSKDNQVGDKDTQERDADSIRAERILLLVNGLDEKARKVFYSICARQVSVARYFQVYLQMCEKYNGGVMNKDEQDITERFDKIVQEVSKLYPDTSKVSADLKKFAKMHDRRSYQLLRFCMDPKSDYKIVKGAIRELNKRIADSPHPTLAETINLFIYRFGLMIYNRSHVPAILDFSKTNEKGLASAAHEILKDMSSRSPEVLETHIRDMCQSLQDDVPSGNKINNPGAVDNLKACAAFARKFPQKLPQERKFIQAMSSYAIHGSPPEAGKHAVSIVMAISSRKESEAKEIVQKCLKGFKYGEAGFLTRLATLSQLMLLAPKETKSFAEDVFDLALKDVLIQSRSPEVNSGYKWTIDLDEDCKAKMWAIKIVVNRVRSHPETDTLPDVAAPVYSTLSTLVASEGELSSTKDTPETHKPQLRLLAAISLLKLCRSQRHDVLLDPISFEKLAEVAQDGLFEVRGAFIGRLRKYLNRNSLPPRFYTIPFLLAYEPEKSFRHEMTTWLVNRRKSLASNASATPVNGKAPVTKAKASTTMESTLPRLLSLLAHHPDYDAENEGLEETSRYIIFYLTCVATVDNISLIYHLAQRVKAHHDSVLAVTSTKFSEMVKEAEANINFDTRLYTLSDLACSIIRAFVESQNWNIQTLPARAKLPYSLFSEIRDHGEAISVAEKEYIQDSLRDVVDNLVREAQRKKSKGEGRKRKSEAGGAAGDERGEKKAKRAKRASGGRIKSVQKYRDSKRGGDDWSDGEDRSSGRRRHNAETEENRRKSGRSSNAVKYIERGDDEDDKEMLGGVAEWEYENGERWREASSSGDDDDDSEGSEADDDNKGSSEASDRGEDVQMTEDADEESEKDTPEVSLPSKTKAGAGTSKRRAAGAVASKPAARSNSKADPKTTQRGLPTRSGRSTRSGAA